VKVPSSAIPRASVEPESKFGYAESMTSSEPRVAHEIDGPSGGRFVLWLDQEEVGELTYRLEGSRIVADHTFVDPKTRGGGLALRLVLALVDWARAEKKLIVPVCSYVRATFKKRHDLGDVVAPSA
jgi:uncharacterized protein